MRVNMIMTDEEMLTLADVAERLQVHRDTVRKWVREGALPAYQFGAKAGYRVKMSDFQAFLEKRYRQGT
jgi:excisionase family DNA binding protein